jgi:putative ABC transport system permease protein
MNDLRYVARSLRGNPGFTTVAVLTLAIGIGSNAAMFAVVNAVLLKPLPFQNAEELMLVHLLAPDRESGTHVQTVWSYPKYRAFLDMQHVFRSTALFAGRDLSLAGDNNIPERVRGEVATDEYPGILGTTPILGRAFTGDEAHRSGVPAVTMISHALWARRYSADPGILGRTVNINAAPYTIVGVLPRGFRGLSGNADVWVPFAAYEPTFLTERYAHGYYLVSRRKADVSDARAIADVRLAGARLTADYPDFGGSEWGATAVSLSSSRTDADVRRAALVLLGAVGFILLIACANLTNLLVAKALGRQREVAVRLAIGASRIRIVRQFLAESLVLAAVGSIAGLLIAAVLLNAAAWLLPESEIFFRTPTAPGIRRIIGADGLTRIGADMIGLDPVTVFFTCAVAAVAAGLIALVPALHSSALKPLEALKTGNAGGTATALHGFRTRGALIASQLALSLVLLAGAGLMIKSASRLHSTGIGVRPEGVLSVRLDLPQVNYRSEDRRIGFYSQLLERVRAIPGVDSAGLGNCAPVTGGCNGTIIGFERGRHRVTPDAPSVGIHWATPEYFSTLGIDLRRGRLFSDQDRVGRSKVVIVNETAARRFWPNADPIGRTVTLGQGGFHDGAEVVGVVSDVRYATIESAPTPDTYIPFAQSPPLRMRLFVRSSLDPNTLARAIQHEVKALDENLPLSEVKTMGGRIDDAMWRTRVAAWLLSAFATVAVLLTFVGIFGVMSQIVAQRTREIGLRMALGAQRADVLVVVMRRAAVLSFIGIALGVAMALGLTRVMTTLLYQVEPNDPWTLGAVGLLLGFVALIACYVPARRAVRVDPMTALRCE